MNQITKEDIDNYYDQNRNYYIELSKSICNNIQGRICHHGVKILNIIVQLADIDTYLEIGVHNGASMSYVVRQDKKSINCYGIDLFSKAGLHYTKDNLSLDQTLYNITKNNLSNSAINLIQGNSRNKKIINRVEDLQFDLLFIDGNHSLEGVKSDFNNYSKLVKPNGIIVFDDYNKNWPGVIKFVDTLKNCHKYKNIGCFFSNEIIFQKIS